MAAKGAVLGVGRLLSLTVLDQKTGRTSTIRPAKRWLAWAVKKRTYCICRVLAPRRIDTSGFVGTGQKFPKLPAEVRAAHAKFHAAAPRGAMAVDVPTPSGPLRLIGLVSALVYDVPHSIRSPEKNKFHWHHAFGDTGHKGGDTYSTRVMPALMKDRKGNLFIRRRPGNIFTVDTWLRG